MITNSNSKIGNQTQITVDIPLQDDRLFRGNATTAILLFLARHPHDSFSITAISKAVEFSRPTITKTVDVLSNNDLVVEERDGTRRLIQINRDRVYIPDNPLLEIPQPEFHSPVKEASETILNELDGVIGIVLYGSVARGDADRRSDIDLWVLVREDRLNNQRKANQVRQSLEEATFDGDRYAFEIDVESVNAVPNYLDDLKAILQSSIALHHSDEFDIVSNMVLHGAVDE